MTNVKCLKGMLNRRGALARIGAAALLAAAGPAVAQGTGTPIRLIVPFNAGGPVDGLGRLVGNKMAEFLGQPIVVDNKGGAGGTLGAELLTQAKPDGQTIMIGTNGTHGINSSLFSKLRYDPVKDFAPIGMIAQTTNVVLVNASSPLSSLADLVNAAKAAPGKLSMGSAGNGTTPHLAGALFNTAAGLQTLHVPYRGSAAALTALMGGQLDYTIEGISVAMPHIKAGKVRALAVTSRGRNAVLPQVPSIAELGYPDVDVSSWGAFFAPAGTPPEIVQRFNTALNKALTDPEVRKRLEDISFTPLVGPPTEVTAATRRELARWPDVVKSTGAKAD